MAVIGALAWALVLSIPGEVPFPLRGKLRAALWAVGIGLLVWAGQARHGRTTIDALVAGVSITVVRDFVGLLMISALVSARELPNRGEWRRAES